MNREVVKQAAAVFDTLRQGSGENHHKPLSLSERHMMLKRRKFEVTEQYIETKRSVAEAKAAAYERRQFMDSKKFARLLKSADELASELRRIDFELSILKAELKSENILRESGKS